MILKWKVKNAKADFRNLNRNKIRKQRSIERSRNEIKTAAKKLARKKKQWQDNAEDVESDARM